MTLIEMRNAVENGNITEELLNGLAYFMYDFDPYGTLDEFGFIEDEGVKDTMIAEMRYQVVECKKELLETLDYAINEDNNTFRKDY